MLKQGNRKMGGKKMRSEEKGKNELRTVDDRVTEVVLPGMVQKNHKIKQE